LLIILGSNKNLYLKQFAELVKVLGSSTKTNDKLQALSDYFAIAGDKDKVWVIAIFSGRRPRRSVSSRLLAEWCMELSSIPGWLFSESHSTVGDLAETIALLLPENISAVQAEEAAALLHRTTAVPRIRNRRREKKIHYYKLDENGS
jgi:DNA ligase-1